MDLTLLKAGVFAMFFVDGEAIVGTFLFDHFPSATRLLASDLATTLEFRCYDTFELFGPTWARPTLSTPVRRWQACRLFV